MRSRVHLLAVPLSFVLIVSAGCLSTDERPNVVLISLDTLRADRLSCYGAPRRTSPNIDELARRGARFVNAFSPSPWTLPSHAAMLTGREPWSLSADPTDRGLYRAAPMLSTMLRDAGYATAGVTGSNWLSPKLGVAKGFGHFEVGPPSKAAAALDHLPTPFFLFFHTYVAHTPFKDRRFTRDLPVGRLAEIYKRENQLELHYDVCCRRIDLTEEERRFLLAFYDGGVALADEFVGRLMQGLERRGLSEKTIVIVTSDHGEEFWDHTGAAAYHGHTLYAELMRVPLVWYDPQAHLTHGRTIPDRVSLIDIVPTLLARLGVDPPAPVDGRDLAGLLHGEHWVEDRPVFGGHNRSGPWRFSVRTDRGTLIRTPSPQVQNGLGQRYPIPVKADRELYLPNDEGEQRDVYGDRPKLAGGLERLLVSEFFQEPAAAAKGGADGIDAELRERLRSLGYIE